MSESLSLGPRDLFYAVLATAGGGFVGTMLRDVALKLERFPPTNGALWFHEIPWVLLGINFVGVYFATRLLRGPLRNHDPNNLLRLVVITGFFGGFTSYSSLFVSFAVLWHVNIFGAAIVIFGALLSGVIAGWLGLMGSNS
jgi:CrcB protein